MSTIPRPTADDMALDLPLLLKGHTEAVAAIRVLGMDLPPEAVEIGGILRRAIAAEMFKAWVHAYLDGAGVPHHPPGPHGPEGCRIGDRMDWLMAQLREVKTERDQLLDALGEGTHE